MVDNDEFGTLACRSSHHCGVYDCDCHDDSCYERDEDE